MEKRQKEAELNSANKRQEADANIMRMSPQKQLFETISAAMGNQMLGGGLQLKLVGDTKDKLRQMLMEWNEKISAQK